MPQDILIPAGKKPGVASESSFDSNMIPTSTYNRMYNRNVVSAKETVY